MTKKEAEDIIFWDGQPVFRYIQEISRLINNAYNWQEKRLKSAKYLNKINYKVKKQCDFGYITGNELYNEESKNSELIIGIKNLVDEYNSRNAL